MSCKTYSSIDHIGVVVFIPPQCGVELRLWGGKTPHTKTGGVEFSTPKLHPTVGWSLVQIWSVWGGVGWSAFFRCSVNSTPLWGGVWSNLGCLGWSLAKFGVEWGGVFRYQDFQILHPTVGWSVGWSFWTSGVEWGGASTPHGNAR